jgi:hypothetical protein
MSLCLSAQSPNPTQPQKTGVPRRFSLSC